MPSSNTLSACAASQRALGRLHAEITTGSQKSSTTLAGWRVSERKSLNARPVQRTRPFGPMRRIARNACAIARFSESEKSFMRAKLGA